MTTGSHNCAGQAKAAITALAGHCAANQTAKEKSETGRIGRARSSPSAATRWRRCFDKQVQTTTAFPRKNASTLLFIAASLAQARTAGTGEAGAAMNLHFTGTKRHQADRAIVPLNILMPASGARFWFCLRRGGGAASHSGRRASNQPAASLLVNSYCLKPQLLRSGWLITDDLCHDTMPRGPHRSQPMQCACSQPNTGAHISDGGRMDAPCIEGGGVRPAWPRAVCTPARRSTTLWPHNPGRVGKNGGWQDHKEGLTGEVCTARGSVTLLYA